MIGTTALLSLANSTAAAIRGSRQPWLILAAALTLRLLPVFITGEHPTDDTADYDEIALNLLSGEGFVSRENWYGFEMHSWRAPAYPFFLAAIYGVFGYGHTVAMVIQALIGAATAVVVYGIGRQLHPPSALLAGLLASVYGPLIRFRLALEPFFLLYAGRYISDHWPRHGAVPATRVLGLILLVNGIVWWQDVALRQTLLALIQGWNLG